MSRAFDLLDTVKPVFGQLVAVLFSFVPLLTSSVDSSKLLSRSLFGKGQREQQSSYRKHR